MAVGRTGGRRLSPCTPAGEEREDGEDPPLLTLSAGDEEWKLSPITSVFVTHWATSDTVCNLKGLQNLKYLKYHSVGLCTANLCLDLNATLPPVSEPCGDVPVS